MAKGVKITVAALALIMFCSAAFSGDRGEERIRQGERLRVREADPGGRARDAAAERIRDIERRRARLSEQFKEERERIRELVIRHRRALTEAEKSALELELKELLEEGFQRRHTVLKERLEHLKEECERIESRIKKSLENRDGIIERRLERLLQAPAHRGEHSEVSNRGMARER